MALSNSAQVACLFCFDFLLRLFFENRGKNSKYSKGTKKQKRWHFELLLFSWFFCWDGFWSFHPSPLRIWEPSSDFVLFSTLNTFYF